MLFPMTFIHLPFSLPTPAIKARTGPVEVDLRSGIPGIDIVGLPDGAVKKARECVRVAIRNSGFTFPTKRILVNHDTRQYGDLSDVKSHWRLKRAIEVAAAGRHKIFLFGPPGSGKTMVKQRLPTILPPLSQEESIEVTQIHIRYD